MRRRRDYRRDWREHNQKERMTLLVSSAFVLAALTLSGVYLRHQHMKAKNDGYTIDFTALDSGIVKQSQNTEKPKEEVADHWSVAELTEDLSGAEADAQVQSEVPGQQQESLEANSAIVESAFTDVVPGAEEADLPQEPKPTAQPLEEVAAQPLEIGSMVRPIQGQVLLPYSMDQSIYFATLDQYKHNPAVIYQANVGDEVIVCASGRVVDIYEDTEIGRAVKLDLGDGYEAIYGQLQEIHVVENEQVNAGAVLGTVASTTKYYSAEGDNLYFQFKKDGVSLNPEEWYQ